MKFSAIIMRSSIVVVCCLVISLFGYVIAAVCKRKLESYVNISSQGCHTGNNRGKVVSDNQAVLTLNSENTVNTFGQTGANISGGDDVLQRISERHNSSINNETTDDTLVNGLHLFMRDRWGPRPEQGGDSRPLSHPVPLVIIGHTATTYCDTFLSCSARLKSMQAYHVGPLNRVDIGYNFLVGGNGNVYEGLGWDMQNYVRNNSIMISAIGNYLFDKVNDQIRNGVQGLLTRGVKLGKLDPDYKLIGHNQAAATQSPGSNLAKEIRNWPHFFNGIIT